MDITFTRGDTRAILVDVYQALPDSLPGRGAPLDLTGYSIWFTAKQQLTDADAAARIRKGNTGGLTGVTIIPNPKTGVSQRIRIDLANGDTQPLPDKLMSLIYDVQIKDSLSSIYTVASGVLNVEPDVTESAT